MWKYMIWGTLCLSLFSSACETSSEQEWADPSEVQVRQTTEEDFAAPQLRDPVLVTTNPQVRKVYDIAQQFYPSFYESERSMCMAAQFLWHSNPHLTDIYRVEVGTEIFIPSGSDYSSWCQLNRSRVRQGTDSILIEPKIDP